jgi:hypothetical protein
MMQARVLFCSFLETTTYLAPRKTKFETLAESMLFNGIYHEKCFLSHTYKRGGIVARLTAYQIIYYRKASGKLALPLIPNRNICRVVDTGK